MDLGDWVVGLRANDEELCEALRRVLAPMLVAGPVYPNLSLYRGAEHGPARELHRLYRRGRLVLVTGSLGELARGALACLDGFLAPPAGLVDLRAEVLLGEAGAVLVRDPSAAVRLPTRRLERLGFRRVIGVTPRLDPATLEVVLAPPRLAIDPDALGRLDARWPCPAGTVDVEPGRVAIAAAVLLGADRDDLDWASPAKRWASLVPLVDTDRPDRLAERVEAIGRLDGRIPVVRTRGFETVEVVEALRGLAR